MAQPMVPTTLNMERLSDEQRQLAEHTLVEGERAKHQWLEAARVDCPSFCTYTLRDQETGEVIRNTWMHEEWHDLAEQHERLILMSFPESGKSTSIMLGRIIWELGRDPSLRIVVISKTYKQAEKITRTLKNLIDHNERVHEVFPGLRQGGKWTDGQFIVRRPNVGSKTPSVQAAGFRGAVQGERIDRVFIDDLEDDDNTRTQMRRKDTISWLESIVFQRMTGRARVVWCTNAWHPKDAAHTFGAMVDWKVVKYPVLRNNRSLFPAKWPAKRIRAKRRGMTPRRWAQLYLCEARDEGQSEFAEAYVHKCLELGRGYQFVKRLERAIPGAVIGVGVDLATGKRAGRKQGDVTALVTGIRYPDGMRQILNIETGRWKGPEILQRLAAWYARYGGIAMVEDNAAQVYLLQFAEEYLKEGMELPPIYAWTTTAPKKWSPSFGVASLAVEMSRGQWIYPCSEPEPKCLARDLVPPEELNELIQEELFFDPKAHSGDRLMAKWFLRELFRRLMPEEENAEEGDAVFGGGDEDEQDSQGRETEHEVAVTVVGGV